MTQISVSPELPNWVLDTFEGKFIAWWIGTPVRSTKDGVEVLEFEGDTENEDDEDMIFLEMDAGEISELARLAEEAGTPICLKIAGLLRNPEKGDIMNGYYGFIDISAIRVALELKNENGQGNRMLEVDDLLHSLVSRFPDKIPYAQVSWAGGATFITPEGVEWFKKDRLLEGRRDEYLATLAAPALQP